MSHASPLIATDILTYLEQHRDKDLLRFITCGSVDDGKSTLIGRLLHDSALIYEDQLAAVTRDSVRFGTTGDQPDLALLVDGLQSEREQGITIDVAYRYFSTAKRKFIIADTPGHEQFTRNMATGASTANLAIILVDASKGILEQTRRHTSIVTLLGIRTLLLAINKMDLVAWSQTRFEHLVGEFRSVLTKLNVTDAELIPVPISALAGDNVVHGSAHMPWFAGPPLMRVLESIEIDRGAGFDDLRFPVQYVNRPNSTFRGYAGTLASGSVRVGDEVMVLPSRKRSRVQSIVTFEGERKHASAPHAVTLTLTHDLDIARGDMLIHPDNAPSVSDAFEATIVWMADQPLRPGRLYDIKLGTTTTQATIEGVVHRRDTVTLDRVPADHLALNEIGRCALRLASVIPYDPYDTLPATGSFILIDRVTNSTVGAGMIRTAGRIAPPDRATNVRWQDTSVTKELRASLKHQRPCVLWFTGLSGAGKSTIANALEQRLTTMGYHTYLLDGDNVRHGLNRDLGFNDEDRVENIRRIAEVAKLMVDAGLIVLTAFISPFRSDRQMVRDMFDHTEFLEAFINAPLEVAERRDPKGLYARARAGKIHQFTGIDSPYEPPTRPEVHMRTDAETIDACVERALQALTKVGAIR